MFGFQKLKQERTENSISLYLNSKLFQAKFSKFCYTKILMLANSNVTFTIFLSRSTLVKYV